MNIVGERIKKRRLELGWTQDRLSKEARISKGFLSDIENGKRNISADTLFALATALGVSMDYLMKGGKPTVRAGEVQIPGSLSAFARSANLSFGQALTLLEMQRQIVAHRSSSKEQDLEKFDWKRFYESVKEFLK
jgi:transcriptional regulator with XRE-family HTH domain